MRLKGGASNYDVMKRPTADVREANVRLMTNKRHDVKRVDDVMMSMSEEIRIKRNIWRCIEIQRLLAELEEHFQVNTNTV